jgi:hypothetical protein
MVFGTESAGYEKTVLSDIQRAWQNFRESVVEQTGFPGWERALYYIDEAIHWELVSNHQYIDRCRCLVRNVLMQGRVPEEVALCLDEVDGLMDGTLQSLREGEMN